MNNIKIKYKVFRVTEKNFYDLLEWQMVAEHFRSLFDAVEWIDKHAPPTEFEQYYIPMMVIEKPEEDAQTKILSRLQGEQAQEVERLRHDLEVSSV